MSAYQDELPAATIGQITVDLSVDRSVEDDYELLRLAETKFLAFTDVPDEVYLHFGSEVAPAIDARDLEGGSLARPLESPLGIGAVYVENPPGSGTMTMLAGVDLETHPQPDLGGIDELQRINETVGVENDGATQLQDSTTATGAGNAATLDLGRARKMVDVWYDLSGAADVTLEVSHNAADWREFQTVSEGSATTGIIQIEPAYQHARAYADANLTELEIVARGA